MFRSQLSRNASSLRIVLPFSSRRSIASFPIPFRTSKLQPSRSTRPPLPPRISRRWVTTDAELTTEGDRAAAGLPVRESKNAPEPKQEEQREQQPNEPENPLQKELDAKNREIIDLKDSYLRQVADFRNLQDRTKRDMESARQFAIQRFATDLLESIDNLDRALSSVPPEALQTPDSSSDSASTESPDKDLLSLHSGLQMTSQILMATLKKNGLERFDPGPDGGQPRKFNPALDEATFMMQVEGKEDGDILMTQSKGFSLNGRVIRPAKVGVVRN